MPVESLVIFVYVLYSSVFDRKYVGIAAELEKRLGEHNAGKTKSTKAFVPWKIVYHESYTSYEEARKREKYLKSAAGRRFLKTKLNLDP